MLGLTKETIEKIKGYFNETLSPEEKIALKKQADEIKAAADAVNAAEANGGVGGNPEYKETKLKDGTVLKYTGDLAAGSECLVVTPEGEMPAPAGEHELEDGTIITVSKEGDKSIISAIKPKADIEQKKQEMEAEVETRVKERVTKIVEKFESQAKEQGEAITKLSKENEEIKLKLTKVIANNTKAMELVDIFLSAPTEKPIEKPRISFVTNQDKFIERAHKALLANKNNKL